MQQIRLLTVATTHQLYRGLLVAAGRGETVDERVERDERDRGAVSLEQVLWFVAAGAAVAIIAGVLWNKINDEANKDITEFEVPTNG